MNDCPHCHQGQIHDRTDDFRTAHADEIVRIVGCRLCGWIKTDGGETVKPDIPISEHWNSEEARLSHLQTAKFGGKRSQEKRSHDTTEID